MRLILLALAIIAVNSCNRNLVKLDYTNAKGEIPQLTNLVFQFNNALAPDSLVNEWDSTEYVRFTPAVAGRFRWAQPNELVFSPLQPLPPATTFRAQFTGELTASSKFTDVDAEIIEFYTSQLKLEDVHVTWVPQGTQPGSAVPSIELFFNYPVQPAALKEKLLIEIEGKQQPFTISTLSDNSRVSVLLTNVQPEDKDVSARVTITKGLIPKGGINPTEENIGIVSAIPSLFNLIINDVSAEHDGSSGTISILTSQQLSSADVRPMIKIEPSVKFTVQTTEEGFNIKSDQFDADKSYTLTLNKGIRGQLGGTLQEQYSNNVAFGELEPAIRFTTNKSVYLSSQGNRMVEMKIVNVSRVKVVISKIYENNLLMARNYGYEPRETRNDEEDGESYEYYGGNLSMGDVIYEQEMDTRSLPKFGNSRLFSFDVKDRLPGFKGIYHIRVRSMQNYWVSDSRFVSVSDMGLIAKEGNDKLYVFANSIKTTDPLQNVNVVAYGNNNQLLGMASTNADGVAEIAYTRKEFAGFKPSMIVAKTENDFNYLPFGSTQVNTSRFDIGGKRINNTTLDAFIYPERDIYRPGERIKFSVIVRNTKWEIPANLPLRFRVLLPNGKELRNFRKTLNEQGSCEGDVQIETSAITGTYTIEVYSSNDVLIGSKQLNIEEFIPDRIKVSTTLDKANLKPGETAELKLNAVNFFGPPAAGRNYELEIQLKPKDIIPKNFRKYVFNLKNKSLSLDKLVREGKLDNEGNAIESYQVPAMFNNTGLLQADFYTTVFDETGRPVSRQVKADVFTQQVFFGIGDDGYWYYPLNQAVKFPLVAVNTKEEPLNAARAVVTIVKHEYRTVLSQSGGYFRYESQENAKVVSESEITVNADKSFYSFTPRSPGNYEIRVSLPGASSYVSRSFYSYGTWGGDLNSFEVDSDGNIDIETNRSTYQPGEKAKVLFKCPFDGKLLVTIEQDRVLSYQYVNVEKRNASMDLDISQSHLPNIFITATLIKPHGISDMPLTAAHGFQNVKVEDNSRRNPVEIIAAKTSRSKKRQHVTIKAAPGSYVTLAAVDNGVLQVTDFATPNPYEYFYSARALQVDAYDLYPFLFPEVRARLSSTGGDAEMNMEKRVNPMPAKRVQIVSYWSGLIKTNGSGEAKVEFDVPQFSGQVRLMAVAYKDNRFGAADAVITIADPIVVSTGMPRFLSPRDTVYIPVTLTNTTSAATSVTAAISARGPVNIIGSASQQVQISPNSESRVHFSAAASERTDTARIKVEIKTGNEIFGEEIMIGVRPASPLQVIYSSGTIAGGSRQKISIPSMDFLDGTSTYNLMLSRNPVLENAEQLRYLVQYPYGCTEQVVSAAFPQLYYNELAQQISKRPGTSANQNVIEAIRKIKLRQLYNGALTLWENEGKEHWWTTIYATHFLLEAKKAGFEVEESLLNTLTGYLNGRLKNKQSITYYYNRDQKKKIAPKEVAYTLYVLALASKSNVPAMNYYKANPSMLSLDSKYLLSASYAIGGDHKKFSELLPASFNSEESVPETGGSFYSPIRDEAIALYALLEVDPNNKQIPVMARHISERLKQREWYSTQECAFSFLALGKLAKNAGKSTVNAVVNNNGKAVSKFTGSNTKINLPAMRNLEIETTGEGKMYYFLEASGVSRSGKYIEEDSYLKVRRAFYDRGGRRLEGNRFKQNDLIIVQVSVEREFDTDIENVVITDILPAGFEIENPRTKEIPGMDWIKDATVPLELDIRDDRIHLFTDITTSKQVFYYAVRAVTPGVYRLGPVAADAMYNGEYHSYHGAGTVRINE